MDLPLYIKVCARLAYPPQDALDYEACLLRNYAQIAAERDPSAARNFLLGEVPACLYEATLRLLRIPFGG